MAALSFIHLTDTHFLPGPDDRLHGIDPAANLRRAIARIRAMAVTPACIVISGDLSNDGESASYHHLRAALAELDATFGVPLLLALGNHDRRVPFRRIILGEANAADESERHYYSRRIGDIGFIVLDSLDTGAIGGLLGAEQLAWLDNELREPAPGGTVVIVHHPILPRGLPRADDYLLADAAEPARSSHGIASSGSSRATPMSSAPPRSPGSSSIPARSMACA